jgi:SAM-dependent methyltransferase
MKCRHCGQVLEHVFLDLGSAPPSNAYLSAKDLSGPELHFPLRVFVCDACWLVQTEDYARADELFRSDYAYFSSTSTSWLEHAARYAEQIQLRLGLSCDSLVIEVATNDGYLLKNFVAAGIPCLGIEPTASTADAAERLGVPVLREFFGHELGVTLAEQGRKADLVVGNNVLAHVPDINDFTAGVREVLKPEGVVTLEFPHLLNLVLERQFDTIYHEHYSYLSLAAVTRIFACAGLRVWDVEELPTHGGSLRVFGCHQASNRTTHAGVREVLRREEDGGLQLLGTYASFQSGAERIKDEFLSFLIERKREGAVVAAYGAAAKGNTLLNFAGVRPDLLPFVCDAAPIKQGKFLPGSRIPILPPHVLRERRPDFVLILPWNISAEVIARNAFIGEWGGKFVTALPRIKVIS